MKKKIITMLFAFIMLSAVFICVGCDKINETKQEYSGGDGDESPTDFAGCELNPLGYDIDNVTFEVYFGSLFGPATGGTEADLEYTLSRGDGFEYAEIYFANHTKAEQENWFLIRRIDDYTSVEYGCFYMPWYNPIKSRFNHHESVTIPKELLTGESGCICFNVYAKPRYDWKPAPMEVISCVALDYTISNEKVILTSSLEVVED